MSLQSISLISQSSFPERPNPSLDSSTDHWLPGIFQSINECEGVSDNTHRLFLVTNEYEQSSTLEKLKWDKLNGDTIIGVSGFFTLNATSARATKLDSSISEIKYLIMLDCSSRVNDFWSNMQKIIARSEDRVIALENIKSLLVDRKNLYYGQNSSALNFAKTYIQSLEREVWRGQSWLSTDEQYAKIKKIFDSGHFTFLRLNLCNQEAMDQIATIIGEKNMSLDCLYLSNTREYAEIEGLLETYQKSLDKLITKNCFVIDTIPRGCYDCVRLTQRVFKRNQSALSVCFPKSPPKECAKSKYYPSISFIASAFALYLDSINPVSCLRILKLPFQTRSATSS
ncbi:MAG: hypothetical protein ACI9S8_002467 [Chlamydiales bacterium]|jgi:hypothetical protein